MPRSALPQDYILDEGTLLDDFEDLTDWGIQGTGKASKEANTEQYRTESQSIKFTALTVGSASFWDGLIYLRKTYSPSADFSADIRPFHIWLYLHSGLETLDNYDLTFVTQVGVDYFTFAASATGITEGWNHLVAPKDAFSVTGSPSWDSIARIEIKLKSSDDEKAVISLDDLRQSVEQIPKVLITFDDGLTSPYTYAYPYMNDRGLRATLYIAPIYIGDDGFLDTDELDIIYASGWAMANHTWSHPDSPDYLTGLTRAQIDDQINLAADWLIRSGYPRGAYHMALPGGYYNSDVLASYAANGIKTGRCDLSQYNPVPAGNIYLLHSNNLGSDTSLATAKGMVDHAIKNDLTLIFHGHKLGESADSSTWTISDFEALIDYIIARKISCVTIDEFYEGLTNPRYRSLPISRSTA